MRVLMIDETETDLTAEDMPFMPNNTVVALNPNDASAVTLQSASASGGAFSTLATIAAGEAQEVTLDEPYIKLAAAGSLILLGN